MPIKQEIGNRYGKLTVVSSAGRTEHKRALWNCVCDCGRGMTAAGVYLRSGGVRSCGCSRRKHGHTPKGIGSRTYTTWVSMRARCKYKSSPSYPNYGRRGITVCERWASSFENFLEDMGVRPEGTSIDRIDNDGSYTPENCKWSTRKEQNRNQRRCRMRTWKGETLPLIVWAERTGFHEETIRSRLRRGLNVEDALTQPLTPPVPPPRPKTTITVGNKSLNLKEWSGVTGTPVSTLKSRLHRGWAPFEIVWGRKKMKS